MASSDKKKQIELQNIIFGINEKKLMVSPEFLAEMTKHYISKRMQLINKNMQGVAATKIPKNFFTYLDEIFTSLDELIVIQQYHKFKDPIPSSVKEALEAKRGRYILAMLNRVWKDANQKAKYDPRSEQPRKIEDFALTLTELISFREKYTSDSFELLNKFYSSVYGHKIDEEPAPAAAETSEEEFTDEFAEVDDGFIEEEFLTE